MITVEELMLENKWDEEEEATVERNLNGSIQLLKNAGAYDVNSDILPLILSSMVSTIMENRGTANTFTDVKMFPLSIQGLINSVKYNMEESDEKNENRKA